MNLYHASTQWATRPIDERFQDLVTMYTVTKAYADAARERAVPWPDLRVEARNDEVVLIGKANVPARFSHYAFGQVAQRIGAPVSYLRTLPATLAAQNLNHGFKERADGTACLLFHRPDSDDALPILRAATTEKYARIWDHEVIARLIDLSAQANLIPARQTFAWDGGKFTANDVSLYASDHDMFAFLMSPDRDITGPNGETLRRGVIVTNSEVGDKRLTVMGFMFRDVCANHIIWGAEKLAEVSLVHVGEIRQRWLDAQVRVRRYLDGPASFTQASFAQWTARIADSKEGVLDTLFGKRLGTQKVLAASWDAVQPEQDGDPRTVWGFAQGMTRYSQAQSYADTRTDLDRAAGRLLSMDF